jgi:hypothetical protein
VSMRMPISDQSIQTSTAWHMLRLPS